MCLLDAMCCFIYKEDEEAELAGGDVKWNTERQVTHMGWSCQLWWFRHVEKMGNEGPAPRIYVGKANGVKMNQQQPEVQAKSATFH